jgi:hypothetical protein
MLKQQSATTAMAEAICNDVLVLYTGITIISEGAETGACY